MSIPSSSGLTLSELLKAANRFKCKLDAMSTQGSDAVVTRTLTGPHRSYLIRAQPACDTALHVRYWPKADMTVCTAHVRFRGQSRHDFRIAVCPLMTQGHFLLTARSQGARL